MLFNGGSKWTVVYIASLSLVFKSFRIEHHFILGFDNRFNQQSFIYNCLHILNKWQQKHKHSTLWAEVKLQRPMAEEWHVKGSQDNISSNTQWGIWDCSKLRSVTGPKQGKLCVWYRAEIGSITWCIPREVLLAVGRSETELVTRLYYREQSSLLVHFFALSNSESVCINNKY